MVETAIKLPVTEAASETKGLEQRKKAGPAVQWPFETLRREIERVFEEFSRGQWRLPFARTPFDVAPVWPGEVISRAVRPSARDRGSPATVFRIPRSKCEAGGIAAPRINSAH